MALTDLLHDEVDALEDLAERGRNAASGTKPKAREAMRGVMAQDESVDIGEAYETITQAVQVALEVAMTLTADELTDITTEAMQTGARLARKRRLA